jgi:hypothetical protein
VDFHHVADVILQVADIANKVIVVNGGPALAIRQPVGQHVVRRSGRRLDAAGQLHILAVFHVNLRLGLRLVLSRSGRGDERDHHDSENKPLHLMGPPAPADA